MERMGVMEAGALTAVVSGGSDHGDAVVHCARAHFLRASERDNETANRL